MEIKHSLSKKTSDKSTVYIGLRYLQLSSREAASKGSKNTCLHFLFYTKEGVINVDKGKADAGKAMQAHLIFALLREFIFYQNSTD